MTGKAEAAEEAERDEAVEAERGAPKHRQGDQENVSSQGLLQGVWRRRFKGKNRYSESARSARVLKPVLTANEGFQGVSNPLSVATHHHKHERSALEGRGAEICPHCNQVSQCKEMQILTQTIMIKGQRINATWA